MMILALDKAEEMDQRKGSLVSQSLHVGRAVTRVMALRLFVV